MKYDKQKVLKQYIDEKTFAVKARQERFPKWILNEQLYNGNPQKTLLTRANLHVPKVFEGVQTMSSRIGALPEADYDLSPEGDENAVDIMKHLFKEDADKSALELIYQDSKIESGIYGRGIIKLIPSNEGCRFELVDTAAFLISPIARNTRDTNYCGQQFIYKTLGEVEEDAKIYDYDQEEIKRMKTQKAAREDQRDTSSEASQKNLRTAYLGYTNVTQYGSKVYEITEWYTYLNQDEEDETKRIPVVITVAEDKYILRCIPIEEVGLPRFPFVTYGAYTRGITFWCPSVADVLRDPNLALNTTLNQQLDNNTYRNFGMLFVDAKTGFKQSSLQPRPLGVTPINTPGSQNVKDAVWQFTPPEITTAQQTFAQIGQIADNAAGLSVAVPGQKGKMTATQQASIQSQIELKTNLLKQNALHAMKELYQLYADCIQENLTIPRKVKIFGYKELTIEGVTKKNFKDLTFMAKAIPQEANAENKAMKQKAWMTLYETLKDDPKIPGQIELRRQLVKQFDLSPTEAEALFQKEEEMPQPIAPVQSSQQSQSSQIPAQPNQNPAITGQAQPAQAAVPQQI